jgi:hypothetical protein
MQEVNIKMNDPTVDNKVSAEIVKLCNEKIQGNNSNTNLHQDIIMTTTTVGL